MTAAPLPRTSAQIRLAHANDSITKLEQARADLEAENKRLRDALQAVVSFWDRLNFDGSSINELHTAARTALKEHP